MPALPPSQTRAAQMAMDSACTPRPLRIVLLNPNTSEQATAVMLEAAHRAARGLPAPGVHVEGRTLSQGEALIVEPQSLAQAADRVAAEAPRLQTEGFDGLIVAGFGDPGLPRLKTVWGPLAVGLGEAGIQEAALGGERFAIVTVTPALHDSLVRAAHTHAPPSQFAGVRYTRGPADGLLHHPQALADALLLACEEAVRLDGAESIVIGGGPLAAAADELSQRLAVRVVNPVSAAVRLLCSRLGVSP